MSNTRKLHGFSDMTRAWLVLVSMTALAWWFGVSAQDAVNATQVALLGVIATACIKIWIIGYQFMELRIAPAGLRYGFLAWVVGIGVILAAMSLEMS